MKAGDRISIPYKQEIGKNIYVTVHKKYTVVRAYRHFVLCERKGYRECFTWWELYQKGLLDVENPWPQMKRIRVGMTRKPDAGYQYA